MIQMYRFLPTAVILPPNGNMLLDLYQCAPLGFICANRPLDPGKFDHQSCHCHILGGELDSPYVPLYPLHIDLLALQGALEL